MTVEIISSIGGKPVRLEASQLVVRGSRGGNILIVAGEYGPVGAVKVAHAADSDFNQVLRAFGYEQVQVEQMRSATPPAGSQLRIGGR